MHRSVAKIGDFRSSTNHTSRARVFFAGHSRRSERMPGRGRMRLRIWRSDAIGRGGRIRQMGATGKDLHTECTKPRAHQALRRRNLAERPILQLGDPDCGRCREKVVDPDCARSSHVLVAIWRTRWAHCGKPGIWTRDLQRRDWRRESP